MIRSDHARRRRDRIVSILRAARGAGSDRVRLASELGVHVRTISRDVARLRAEGVSVIGCPGVGGGLRLPREMWR